MRSQHLKGQGPLAKLAQLLMKDHGCAWEQSGRGPGGAWGLPPAALCTCKQHARAWRRLTGASVLTPAARGAQSGHVRFCGRCST